MAHVVLGLATSHGPMLTLPPERWSERASFDMSLPALAFRGKDHSFDQLVEARRPERLDRQLGLDIARTRAHACRVAIDRLADLFEAERIDQVVIIGNDQMEIFSDQNLPAFLVCWADWIDNIPFSEDQKRLLGPGISEAEPGHHGAERERYPGLPQMGRFLIEQLLDGFDLSASGGLPELPGARSSGAPHAFGFVYRQIFRGRPVPNLPVFVNTFYPPTQPSLARCLAFGRAIGRAIGAWQGGGRIAVIGSGGLSHFVIDETLDRAFLAAIERRDFAWIASIPEAELRSGTSELKNWAITAAALDELGLTMRRADYIPCYRSLAGTGAAMAFAEWN